MFSILEFRLRLRFHFQLIISFRSLACHLLFNRLHSRPDNPILRFELLSILLNPTIASQLRFLPNFIKQKLIIFIKTAQQMIQKEIGRRQILRRDLKCLDMDKLAFPNRLIRMQTFIFLADIDRLQIEFEFVEADLGCDCEITYGGVQGHLKDIVRGEQGVGLGVEVEF